MSNQSESAFYGDEYTNPPDDDAARRTLRVVTWLWAAAERMRETFEEEDRHYPGLYDNTDRARAWEEFEGAKELLRELERAAYTAAREGDR